MKQQYFLFLTLFFFLFGCTKKIVPTAPEPSVTIEERTLDPVEVTAPPIANNPEDYQLPKYNASYTRVHDLIHTKLDIRFDWQNEKVIGKATLTLKPLFYPSRTLQLDAKGLTFNKVAFEGQRENLDYEYDDNILTIDLGREFKANEEYKIFIDYVAHPAATGGSSAITSNQGLFFINPRNETPNKPQQIWTQGETEWNSRWFPTIDKPNERCTDEIYITVEDRFQTLSNGLLKSSKKNADGTRTDYWKMNQPHAPYLFMMAVGEFAVVKDTWRGKPILYFVEKKYEKDARAIFSNTIPMLEFFSEKLGVEYPWDKFAQIIVRDYVSGAMENTTAVIFGEFIQKTSEELIDANNESIVAHEMFHHWFGDLVTCESWANLTMNEGFANYSEYLWYEHAYGADEADLHRKDELKGYLSSSARGVHDLIYFGYNDNEDMFDAHSYNKGGLVLHMLRNLVGDDAFFKSLNVYLTKNKYTAVEAHNLRLAFEEVTGKDLNWFFNQWYFSAGHPILEIKYGYDAATHKATVTLEQTQDVEKSIPIFKLPMAVDVYLENGKPIRHQITMTKRLQTFEFDAATKPLLIDVDADRALLIDRRDSHTSEEYAFQYLNTKKFLARWEAFEALLVDENANADDVFAAGLNDNSWFIKMRALEKVDISHDDALKTTVANLAKNAKNSNVRASAMQSLAATEDKAFIPNIKAAIQNEKVMRVKTSAMIGLYRLDNAEGVAYAEQVKNDKNPAVIGTVGEIFAATGDTKYLSYFEKKWKDIEGFELIPFFDSYRNLVTQADGKTYASVIKKMKSIALNTDESKWLRVSGTKTLNDLREDYKIEMNDTADKARKELLVKRVDVLTKMIEEIKSNTKDTWLLDVYNYYQY
ncbi:MAG TPA: M1 family peptidase [Phaeodactylibacter sp.]|nr:M1 family peptidase [Phaeodactylibacter sp.]